MIKKGDFIELDYTAKLKDEKLVFDTTQVDVAKATGNFNPKFKYGPVIICVGEQQLIPGLDDALVGKDFGKFTIEVTAEKGFGKKRADLLKLIPLRLFKSDKIEPYPGLEVNIDDQIGMVKSVSGGRVIVDFNHPLSGKDLVYDVDIKGLVTDAALQVNALLDLLHLHHHGVDILDNKATVLIHEQIPEEITKAIADDLKRLTRLDDIVFVVDEKGHSAHDGKNSHGQGSKDKTEHEKEKAPEKKA
jgi:FKBP-type peptidyl-prolyl cis-trans isomerase 2